ncbi:hypothetical protein TVAG_477770 [Trichomonas vaginalis G3]|uniref:DUF6602 domain-containing protein n=1 Tax=Trichomonas vaginalis (strain ATCC PRA-98 / G3) TaxID=412133 RepID=A2G251_TRIV3|nr:SLL0572 protein family [Trichomonas vaginalis G3]EAX88774.1 hypothetical protein TVAG_477770 [Trichomonas vaginalis G3]KAI5532880.1 SLL0572 protein family [Trichomonas vaginalis G3]|eukprot:XP_001301704.1 hypothetical protein [Trichomonas vaginalis G3]
MATQSPRTRTLILGCDFSTFHIYWRYFAQAQDREVVGFVYCEDGEPPIRHFKGIYKHPHSIYSLRSLERTIVEKRIQTCVIQAQNIPMPVVQSLINRILSTGTCGFEFLPKASLVVKSFKPVITLTSLAPKLGKTQVGLYFCSLLKKNYDRVAIIYPLHRFQVKDDVFYIEKSPHYEFNQDDVIEPGLFTPEEETQIKNYQACGAYKIFVTADYRKSVICAEQCANIIVFDASACEIPYINADAEFCVVSAETLDNVRSKSLWPGIVNVMVSENIIVLERGSKELPRQVKISIDNILKEHTVMYALSQAVIDDPHAQEMANRSVLVIDPENVENGPQIASKYGAIQIQRSTSPLYPLNMQTDESLNSIVNTINSSNADVILVTINQSIPNIDNKKTILYTSLELNFINDSLRKYINKFFNNQLSPPLKDHFEAQVDIIMALSQASEKELFVLNNDSANREAFVRLFLRSHLPTGFRVTTGEIIDCSMNQTGQLDVIIVNDACPRFTIDGTDTVISPVPADSVLGVIEVKTTLTQESLKKALSQMRPVKALMPSHATLQLADGHIVEDPLKGKIITGIFSFAPSTDIEEKIPSILKMYPKCADFIVLPNNFCFFSEETLKVCGMSIGEHDVINGYAKFTAKGMGLALIFGILNALAATRRFSGLHCIKYLSGNWGGRKDLIERNMMEQRDKMRHLGKYVIKLNPGEKEAFFRQRSNLMNRVNEINQIIQGSTLVSEPEDKGTE